MKKYITILAYMFCLACSQTESKHKKSIDYYQQIIQKLSPLHHKLPPPKAGEWLAEHQEEGQSLDDYKNSDYVQKDKTHHKFYILPLGDFDKHQNQVLDSAIRYMALFLDLQVIKLAPQKIDILKAIDQ